MKLSTSHTWASVETADHVSGDLDVAIDWRMTDRHAVATVVSDPDLGEDSVGGQVGISVERTLRRLVKVLMMEQLAMPRTQLDQLANEQTAFPGVAVVAVRTSQFMLVPWRYDELVLRHPTLIGAAHVTRRPPEGAQMLKLDDLADLMKPKT